MERFLRTMEEGRLGDIVLQPLRLTANFRSQPTLVSCFNRDFRRIFPPPDDPALLGGEAVDVPFVAATAARPESPSAGVVWHTSVLGEEEIAPEFKHLDNVNLAHRAQEALTIRRIIEQRLELPLPAGDKEPWRIAVLGRNRSHLSAIVTEFKQDRGSGPLPFRAVELDPLRELQEVSDAFALTRALLHPADRTAWLAVLHAPWCGLGRADLLALTGRRRGVHRRTARLDSPRTTQRHRAATPRSHLAHPRHRVHARSAGMPSPCTLSAPGVPLAATPCSPRSAWPT